MAAVDPRSGYCSATRTFHSLRHPPPTLPPPSQPLSFPAFAFALSLLPSPLPPHAALVDAATGEAVSYAAFLARVRALAEAFRADLGLSHGDVALLLAPNSVHLPVLVYALLSIGAVVSPVNPALTAREISRPVQLSQPAVAFAIASTAAKLPSTLPAVLLDSPRFQDWLQLQAGSGEHGGDEPAPALVEEDGAAVVVQQSDTAAILYSSGTTAAVKAVAISHGSFIAALAMHEQSRRAHPAAERRRVLQARPTWTAMAFSQALVAPALGDTLVVMSSSAEEPFRDIMEAVERHRVSDILVPPPVVVAMARGKAAGIDVSSLRWVVCGGAALPVPAEIEFRKRSPGVLLGVGYGMTEAAGGISIRFDHSKASLLGSVGQLSPGVQAKIVDQVTGELLPINQNGELHLRGLFVMKGYIGDDKAKSEAFDSDGWLKTGDLCYIDQDGFLFIVDRIKDLMTYNGYKVKPAELEQVLHSVPGIADAVVIPYPHEELGDIPTALIVREQDSNVSEKDIMNYVADQVAPYKRLRNVIFVNSIPRPRSGKIVRRELLRMVKEGDAVME